MTRYSIEGAEYTNALKIIEALKGIGIEATITIGGINISPESQWQTDRMKAICKKFKVTAVQGVTHSEGLTLMNRKEYTKNVIEVYYDKHGFMGGYYGCYRARLKEDHAVHSSGKSEPDAVDELLKSLKSRNQSTDAKDYSVVRIGEVV